MNEYGRKIRNANRMPKSDNKTESNLRRRRREEGKKENEKKIRRRKGKEVKRKEVERREERREIFDLKNQELRFISGRTKPYYHKSNSN